MANKQKYIELSQQQFHIMTQAITKESYEWEQPYLEKRLIGALPKEIHWYGKYNSRISDDEIKQNMLVDEINKYIDKYNYSICTMSKDIIYKIKSKYKELYNFGTINSLISHESDIENAIIFNKIILITGVGGIGKSQYLYEFGNKLKEKKYKNLLVYGKYCNNFDSNIFDEILYETKNEKFYLIVDAINEFDSFNRNMILEFIEVNKENENLRVIISYRNNSLPNAEYSKLKNIATDEEIFLGVSSYDAIEKISEKYNVDLSIFEHMLENNNPYHLKLIVKFISNNILITDIKKPLEKGTFIYENLIQSAISKDRWTQTKYVVEEIIKIKEKRIPIKKCQKSLVQNVKTILRK